MDSAGRGSGSGSVPGLVRCATPQSGRLAVSRPVHLIEVRTWLEHKLHWLRVVVDLLYTELHSKSKTSLNTEASENGSGPYRRISVYEMGFGESEGHHHGKSKASSTTVGRNCTDALSNSHSHSVKLSEPLDR